MPLPSTDVKGRLTGVFWSVKEASSNGEDRTSRNKTQAFRRRKWPFTRASFGGGIRHTTSTLHPPYPKGCSFLSLSVPGGNGGQPAGKRRVPQALQARSANLASHPSRAQTQTKDEATGVHPAKQWRRAPELNPGNPHRNTRRRDTT